MIQELYAFVDKEEENVKNVDSCACLVQKEILLYEASNRRPKNLEKLFNALKTIKPTSVEAERAFSGLDILPIKLEAI